MWVCSAAAKRPAGRRSLKKRFFYGEQLWGHIPREGPPPGLPPPSPSPVPAAAGPQGLQGPVLGKVPHGRAFCGLDEAPDTRRHRCGHTERVAARRPPVLRPPGESGVAGGHGGRMGTVSPPLRASGPAGRGLGVPGWGRGGAHPLKSPGSVPPWVPWRRGARAPPCAVSRCSAPWAWASAPPGV